MHLDTSLVPCWVTDLFSAPAAVRLGWVCIHSLWQGVAVAAVLAAALRLIPRQSSAALALRYRLAAAALAALPVAAGGTFFLVPAWSDAVKPQPSQMNIAPRPAAVAEGAPGMAGFGAAPAPLLLGRQEVQPDSLVRLAAWLPLVALAWTVGAALAAARMACGWWITRRLVARATPAADGRLQGRVNHWRRIMRIDGAVRILASAAVETPVVVGWLKPVILWPAAALMGMPAHEIDAVLAHELAHVRRRDALMNLLQACIDVLFFHHPAAWWISRQVRAEREHCADDLAVSALEADRAGSRLSYARALLALEQRRQTATLAVAANGGRLLDRIRRLAGDDHEPAGTARLLAAGLTAVALIAVTVSFTTNPRRATADELPEDTNTIESLTPEQARKLVKEFPGVSVDYRSHGFGKVVLDDCLPLNGLTTLSADTAKVVAAFKGRCLMLNGLSDISTEPAKELATFKGFALQLDGLTTLSHDAAAALAESTCRRLSLDGLPSLNADTAKKLAKFNGDLSLGGLSTLDVATAGALGKSQADTLFLSGLAALDVDTAKAIVKFDGQRLYVSGLMGGNTATAEAIAGFKGRTLVLMNLTTLDVATAKAIARFKGHLRLNDLATIDAETAKSLAEFTGPGFALPGLTTLDVDTARVLAASKSWDGELPSLTRIDDAAARVIAQSRAWRAALSELITLNAVTLRVLAEDQSDELPLFGLTTLDAGTAKVLAGFQGSRLTLGGRTILKSLDAATAAALAKFKGRYLSLHGPSKLDTDAAKAIAGFKGEVLYLAGPTTLDPDTAKALAEFTGKGLVLAGLTTLDAASAKAFLGFGGSLVVAIDSLDSPDAVAVAQALATRKGPLYLPNLKKISPRTLSALLDKEDLEIPLIETLELIPEPDGSPTDDVVIPEKFQQRQRR